MAWGLKKINQSRTVGKLLKFKIRPLDTLCLGSTPAQKATTERISECLCVGCPLDIAIEQSLYIIVPNRM